jgi:hypothetical protein
VPDNNNKVKIKKKYGEQNYQDDANRPAAPPIL